MSYIRHTRAPDSFTCVQALTPTKALKECEQRRVQALALLETYSEELKLNGSPLDYSFERMADVFMYMSKKLRLETFNLQYNDLPKVLSDLKGKPVYDFDAASVAIVVALGIYFGEALVKKFDFLEWHVGKKSRVYWGQPVVDWKKSILATKLKLKWFGDVPYIMVADTILKEVLLENKDHVYVNDAVYVHVQYAQKAFAYWKQIQQQVG